MCVWGCASVFTFGCGNLCMCSSFHSLILPENQSKKQSSISGTCWCVQQRTTMILLCEDGSLRIYMANVDNTNYWMSPFLQPHSPIAALKPLKKKKQVKAGWFSYCCVSLGLIWGAVDCQMEPIHLYVLLKHTPSLWYHFHLAKVSTSKVSWSKVIPLGICHLKNRMRVVCSFWLLSVLLLTPSRIFFFTQSYFSCGMCDVFLLLTFMNSICVCVRLWACRSPCGQCQLSHRLLWALPTEQWCGGELTSLHLGIGVGGRLVGRGGGGGGGCCLWLFLSQLLEQLLLCQVYWECFGSHSFYSSSCIILTEQRQF